ncbi:MULTISPECIES: hypothetical protein [Nocardiopsis]|uniref:hypothetical protein n=1 Tax=Nocardiopsis TaxID=2013 RepID=UPI0003451BBE|nr:MULTISPECIES: hypothetical protein [Nocardiopsis]MBQ1083374.1 hypothetical protein [Nocardiopsis sp. B62]PWV45292.1 hypothetical protein BDW27_11860 [Nocardiopsis sp. L17-MgMaSL7]
MRTIGKAPWRQKVLWITLGIVFAAGALAVLVPTLGGSWTVYFFVLAPFVVSGVWVLASGGSRSRSELGS